MCAVVLLYAQHKYATYLPHTAGRYQTRRFRKATVRLTPCPSLALLELRLGGRTCSRVRPGAFWSERVVLIVCAVPNR